MPDLALSNIINVVVQGAPSGLSVPNINTAALFSSETPLVSWGSEAYRIYRSPSGVATDWGTDSDAYALAVAFFSQTPNPLLTFGYLAIVPLLVEEDVKDAIVRVTGKVFFTGILLDAALAENKLVDLSAAVQATRRMLFYASSDAADYAPGGPLDDIRAASKTNTRGLFHSSQPFLFAAAYCARLLSTDFSGSRTAQTMNLKPLSGIDPDATMTETEHAKAKAAGVDVYASSSGISGLFTSGENLFADELYSRFWLAGSLEVAGFNALRQTNTKVPQTEEGIAVLKNAYRAVCAQAVANGYAAPGTWNSPDRFGDPEAFDRNIADLGFYIYSAPLSAQSQADREDRKAPLIQIALKEAGAVHSGSVTVNVNA